MVNLMHYLGWAMAPSFLVHISLGVTMHIFKSIFITYILYVIYIYIYIYIYIFFFFFFLAT